MIHKAHSPAARLLRHTEPAAQGNQFMTLEEIVARRQAIKVEVVELKARGEQLCEEFNRLGETGARVQAEQFKGQRVSTPSGNSGTLIEVWRDFAAIRWDNGSEAVCRVGDVTPFIATDLAPMRLVDSEDIAF